MTTENTPVGTPAEKDAGEHPPLAGSSPGREQSPYEEVVNTPDARDESPLETSDEPVSSSTTLSHQQPANGEPATAADTLPADPAAGEAESQEPIPTPPAESPPASPPMTSAAESAAETKEPAPARRVRLNPTASPDALKPIPSLRPPETPPHSTPSVAADAVQQEPLPESAGENEAAERIDSALPEETAEQQRSTSQGPEADSEPTSEEPSSPPPPPAEPVALPSKHESLDAGLEAELDAAMAGSQQVSEAVPQIEESADTDAGAPSPDMEVKRGTKLKGIVQSIHGDDMFLEFGLRMAGVLSRRQFGLRKQPMQGEPLEVVVHRVDEKEGLIHVNLPTGTSRIRGDWEALTVGQNVECMVHGTNKGGLEVTVGALRGFMPASQVELGYVPDLTVYIGQKLKARIAEVNPKRRKLVLSRRSLLEEEREHSQQELFEKVEPGQQLTGRVKTIKDYGAFVDIGGADGLLHVAQISWTRINHPSEVLQEGQEVDVQVLSVDKEKKKISLGMRQLTQNPWKAAESKYAQGSQVTGKVTRIENFGAFIELEEGVEGLVHISELDHKRVKKVSEVLSVGQEVDVQVLEVDPKRKRVGLSVKALIEKPDETEKTETSSPIRRQRSVDSLVGGTGEPTGGQLFGDPSKFGG